MRLCTDLTKYYIVQEDIIRCANNNNNNETNNIGFGSPFSPSSWSEPRDSEWTTTTTTTTGWTPGVVVDVPATAGAKCRARCLKPKCGKRVHFQDQ